MSEIGMSPGLTPARSRRGDLWSSQLPPAKLAGHAPRRDAPAGPALRLGFSEAAEPGAVLRGDVGASLRAVARARDPVHRDAGAAGDSGGSPPARNRR